MKAWTTLTDLQARVLRAWHDGRIFIDASDGTPALFPWRLPIRGPTPAELGSEFARVQAWVQGYAQVSCGELEWKESNHRQLGHNRLPSGLVLADASTAAAFVNKSQELTRYRDLAARIVTAFPTLQTWLGKRAMTVLEHDAAWDRILAVLRWCVAHPRPSIYLRQIDLPGVDSKFVEQHQGILAQLLDLVLPPADMHPPARGLAFAARYGFASRPLPVRMRFLDARAGWHGLSDITCVSHEFAQVKLPVRRVFMTENEINFLAFPQVPDSMVIFGGGYGFERLAAATCLRDCELIYWGDIDTHGFAILAQLRRIFPQVRSCLMDEQTLLAHQTLWGHEDKPLTRDVEPLTPNERQTYEALRTHTHGHAVRLEQERIGYAWVCAAIATICGSSDRVGQWSAYSESQLR